ncbi:helix-turn-helix transcriptional regulator [Flavobacterium sp. MDT1-60]|uniref:helix-turn-helix domain-containing protein n=1 Tax=Flavobacterium sp. MDT1-60 TaxID=1979344 RepID=UPI00177EC945|nr:helix-turn-helix transcriptional regulator [Flavobacterium sp. MDT1-60]QOG00915.1 helix-turn-helix transcriptional regulator [Flavobacterium sp. MDT1-60]
MVNIDDFVKRLEIILDYYNLNASSFADKIGVQRSSMSHLLSGRNKPSLDFVMKILEVFPDVDLYWILNGKGNFPKTEDESLNSKQDIASEIVKPLAPISSNENFIGGNLFSEINYKEDEKSETRNSVEAKNSNLISTEGEIEKIVFFYKNGTFKVYIP